MLLGAGGEPKLLKPFSGEVRASTMEKIKGVVRLGMVWAFSSFPTIPPNKEDLFPLDPAKVMQCHQKPRAQMGQAVMLCRDVALHRACEFCLTSGRCGSLQQWQRWGGSHRPLSCSLNNRFSLCPVVLEVLQPGAGGFTLAAPWVLL